MKAPTTYLAAPRYIMKCEATFCQPGEHWFKILDREAVPMVRVPMTDDQAEHAARLQKLERISPREWITIQKALKVSS